MQSDTARVFRRLIRPIAARVKLMVGRAVLTVINDATKIQSVQIHALAGEILDNVERFQNYGFSGHPHPGAEAVLVSLGGMRQHPIVVAVDDRRYRPKGLAEGEVVIYTSEDLDDPHRIWLKSGRIVRIEAGPDTSVELSPDRVLVEKGSTQIEVVGNAVNITGDTNINGAVDGYGRIDVPGRHRCERRYRRKRHRRRRSREDAHSRWRL